MLNKIMLAMNTFFSTTAHLQNYIYDRIDPLNAELNLIRSLLALFGAHHILHVSRIRVNCCSFVLSKMSDPHKISDVLLSLLECYNVSFVNSLQSTSRKIPEDLKIPFMCYFVCTWCMLCT
jgi:hypothetical protein